MNSDAVYALLAEANPVPDPNAATTEVAEVGRLRSATNGSKPMTFTIDDDVATSSPNSPRRRWVLVAAAAAIVLLGVGAFVFTRDTADPVEPVEEPAPTLPAAPSGEAGSVVITTEWANGETDFSAEGTFEVTEGADVLGCPSGSFVDLGIKQVGTLFNIEREWTCGDGDTVGTFTTVTSLTALDLMEPSGEAPWNVTAAVGDFTGLQGEGVITADVELAGPGSSDDTATELITGTFRFDS